MMVSEEIDLDEVNAERCRRRLFTFVQEFWYEVSPEDPVWNWHIEALCDEIQEDILRVCRLPQRWIDGICFPAKPREAKLHDTIINIPPGTTKSTICTVMAPAWAWTVDASLRIITASYSGDLSMDHAVKSRDIIQSDKYQRYFPEIEIRKDANNKAQYKNTKMGERYSTSVGGTITGIHAHLIIVDDPINTKKATSDGELEEASNFMDQTLSTRKVDKKITHTILVMQRLHALDPSGNWLRKKGKRLKHICLPATIRPNIKPEKFREKYVNGLLDAVRMDYDVLADMKLDMGSYGYAGQMEQDPTPAGGGVWQQWIISIPDKDMPTPEQMTGYGTDWDTAYTEKTTNAGSASITSGKFNGRMYIDDFGAYWKEFPELINLMRLKPSPHYIEAKASGKSAKQTLVNAGIPAIEVQVNGDKMVRARDATPKAEAGMVCCRASILDKLYNDEDQGILKFPNAPKADVADTLSQAVQRHFGTPERIVSFGWDDDTQEEVKAPHIEEKAAEIKKQLQESTAAYDMSDIL